MAFLKGREGRMTGKSFNSPVLTTPALGTPASGVMTNMTGAVTASVVDGNVQNADLASGTDGNIISYDSSGNPVAIATGNDGQVLLSAGAGAQPAFGSLGGGLTHLQTTNIPTDATTSGTTFDNFYDSSYTTYYMVIRDLECVTDTAQIGMRFNEAGDQSVEDSSYYQTAMVGLASTDPAYNINYENQAFMLICANLGSAAGEQFNATFVLNGMQNAAVFPSVTGSVGWQHGSDYQVTGNMFCYYSNDYQTSYSGITLLTNGGNFQGGSVTIFGIAES